VVTIRDLAREAGVSIGTVSRAFRGYKDISAETKAHILETAQRIGYTPNLVASNLSSKKKQNIAFIMASLLSSDPRDTLAFQLIQGIMQSCLERGVELVTYAIDTSQQKNQSYIDFCKQRNIAGAVICGISSDDVYFSEIAASEIAVVSIDFALCKENQGWVSVDNVLAARDAMRHLYAAGCKCPLIVSGRRNAEVAIMRESGVQLALAERNQSLPPENLLYGKFDEQTAYRVVRERLRSGKNIPDGIFCLSDLMALGAMRAVKDAGYRVPEDIPIIGFDGVYIGEYVQPSLSTIYQDVRRIGYEAANLLCDIMNGTRGGSHVVVPHRLLARQSTQHEANTNEQSFVR